MKLLSLKNRILLFTVIPASVLLIIAGAVMTSAVGSMVDHIFRSGAYNNAELVCSRAEAVIDDYVSAVVQRADNSNISNFLKTADNRDTAEDNAYYSFVLGELDYVITMRSNFAQRAWAASFDTPNLLITNSSCGWTPREDFDITRMSFYDALSSGEKDYIITDPYEMDGSGNTIVSVIAAVKDSRTGRRIGAVGVDIDMDAFYSRINALEKDSDTLIFIRSGNGLVIHSAQPGEVFGEFSYLQLEQGEFDGYANSFVLNGEDMIGSYSDAANSGWRIYALQSVGDIDVIIFRYSMSTIIMFAVLIIVFSVLLAVVSEKIAKPLQDYTRLINGCNIVSDNPDSSDTLLVPAGCTELEHFASGFNSLTKRNREMMNKLRQMNIASEREKRLYQTALESSSDIVFEYDIETDTLITYGSIWEDIPKTMQLETRSFTSAFAAEKGFVIKDTARFMKFFREGECSDAVRLGVNDDNWTLHWYRCEGVPIFSDENSMKICERPVKIVGKFHNIDDLVTLKNVAECDSLTGFLNKGSTRDYISDYLDNRPDTDSCSAALLIDIDNFKHLNDKLGHAAGDRALADISDTLRQIFGGNDILGRIGGDEFFVFIRNANGKDAIGRLCGKVCEKIHRTYSNDGGASVTISASIGVAVSPEHGNDFDSLYAAADIAMYLTKSGGKNSFTIFNGEERPQYYNAR